MAINLYDYQLVAMNQLRNGYILCGGVGSGKSRTGIAYYYTQQGGDVINFKKMVNPKDLYIITTARKRDTKEWEGDLAPFLLSSNPEVNGYSNLVTVESWNNIVKFKNIKGAFFIFDEQRVVGSGAWVKAFLEIAKNNDWILLSATPGDTWMDYIPVFLANGFYRNRTEFIREHVVYSSYCKNFPKIDRYVNTGRLIRLRNKILVDMDYTKPAKSINLDIWVDYNLAEYKLLLRERWNHRTDEPIVNASELCYELRRIVNTDGSRLEAVLDIYSKRGRIIVFYNFNYELELLKELCDENNISYTEWNGHKHQPIPETERWVYLVQYTAGAEGWNCIKTDTIIFFSQNYSYKIMEQSSGRIDRLNTPYSELYYYHIKSRSGIDLSIDKAIKAKKKFNERKFVGD